MNCTVGVLVNATKLKLVVKQIPSDEGRELLSIATRCSENRMARQEKVRPQMHWIRFSWMKIAHVKLMTDDG